MIHQIVVYRILYEHSTIIEPNITFSINETEVYDIETFINNNDPNDISLNNSNDISNNTNVINNNNNSSLIAKRRRNL